MALPTASTPGYTTFTDIYGKKWVACVCLAEWLTVYQQLARVKKLVSQGIDPWQLTGGAAASAGTHTQGGVFDLLYQTTDAHVMLCREMGAPATWRRSIAQGFAKVHTHGVLNGCPHNSPARYQLTAQAAGYDGLGTAGRGGKDPHPDPSVYRTWSQGITWAKSEIARLTIPPVIATKTVITATPSVVALQHPVDIAVTVTPAVNGSVQMQWYPNTDETKTFRNFGPRVQIVAGKGRTVNRPGANVDHNYRAVFTPADPKRYRTSVSTPVVQGVVDLRALVAQQASTTKALAELKATVSGLQKPSP